MSLKLTEKSLSSERKCVFCNLSVDDELKFGKIYEYDGIITHYYCLLLSSNMQQRGRDEDGILGFLPVDIRKELKRGQRLICTYCKKNGATLGCCNRKCKKVFHYPCGIKNNTLHQFFEEYKSFCVIHRPKQIVDVDARNIAPEHPMCYICYDHVHRDNIYQTLWAPCCKKNAWFHRDCVQRLALSAGYFFKCPLCNNNKAFQKAMLDSGIYVPSQDASWELVPNAFQELLYRHNKCDADKCKCPQGREYTSSNAKWELTLCRTCGSQGIHIECGNLRLINPVWDCDECSTILNKSNVRHNSNRIQSNSSSNILTKESDDESSDSDISIGQELSLDQSANNLNCTDIILRPGPRSAKLKQLQEHAKMTTINTTTSNTSIEQLTDILNEQQAAHQSISDEILLTNSTGCKSSTLNTNVTIPENTTSNRLPTKKVIEDIIIVDSDDDNDNNDNNRVIKPPEISSTSNNTESPNDMSDCTISYMNIKISGVTSLSTEISTNTYNTSSKSTIAQGTSSNSQQMNPSTYLMKRKADSSDVVSMIVRCINDSIDSPDVTLKKQKIDNNGYHNSPAVLSRGSNSILRGVTGGSYRNGISLPETAVLAFHGKEFVVPLENSMSTVTSSNIIDENSSQSASDGDAGPKQAGFMYQPNSCTWRKVITTESSGYPDRRCCSDHGNGDYTENKRINDDSCSSSSSGESDTGIDRDRLMQKKVLLRDLKFHICNNNIITMKYRDNLTMNIAVDTKRERKTVNNYPFFCTKNNLKLASRVRGPSNTQYNSNMSNNSSRYIMNNKTIILSNCDRASEIRDTRLLPRDPTHLSVNGDMNNLYKFQQTEAAKENLVPDSFEKLTNGNSDKLSSPERINKRFRYEYNNENDNIAHLQKYINTSSITSNPGTSGDELREFSYSNINQKHFTSTSNIYSKSNRKFINWQENSLSPYFNFRHMHCCVSIDLKRIQSIFDKIPIFILKKNYLLDYQSFDDSTISKTTVNEYEFSKSLRRSKSESNISSICTNYSSNSLDNYYFGIDFVDLQKFRKVRKRKRTDKHDYVR